MQEIVNTIFNSFRDEEHLVAQRKFRPIDIKATKSSLRKGREKTPSATKL